MEDWLFYKEKGNKEYTEGNYKSAIELYDKAISKLLLKKEINSNQDILYSNVAQCYIQLNNLDKAIEFLLKATDINPMNIKSNKRLFNCYLKLGRFKEAILYNKRCENIDKDNVNIHQEDDKLLNYVSKIDSNLKNLSNSEVWDKCEIQANELLKYCDSYFEIKLIYIESLLKQGKIVQGSEYIKDKLSENEKKNEYVIYLSALSLYYSGKYEKSRSLLSCILKLNSKYKSKYEKLSSILEIIDEIKGVANKAFTDGKYDEAIDKYLVIIKLDPSNRNFISTIYANIALCKMKKHRYNEAHEYINLSISNNESYIKAYYRRALINIELSEYSEAEKDLKKILELEPSNKDAKFKLEELEMEKEKRKRKDYYRILDISATASESDIRQAYKKLAAKWHPDKNSSDEITLNKAKKMFEEITEAYDVLGNISKRRKYDLGQNYNHNNDEESSYSNDGLDKEFINKRAEEIYYGKKK